MERSAAGCTGGGCVFRYTATPLKVKKSGGYQADVAKRLKIEEAAMGCAAGHYASMNFVVKLVPTEKKGWDLEARRGPLLLRVEVKGCSGVDALAELTPNEYAKLLAFQDSYRVCIVTRAPTIPGFTCSSGRPKLVNGRATTAQRCLLEEKIAARVWVE